MFLGFRLRIVIANSAETSALVWSLVRLRVVIAVTASAIISATAFLLVNRDQANILIGVAVFKAAESISDICYGGFQRLNSWGEIRRSIFWRSLSAILLGSIVIPFWENAAAGSAAVAFVRLTGCVLDLKALSKKYPLPSSNILISATENVDVRSMLSLGLVALLGSISYNIPRYFLAIENESAVGYYGAIAYVGITLTLFASSLTETFVPGFTQLHRQNLYGPAYRRDIGRLYLIILAIGLIVLSAGWLFGSALLAVIFGKAYSSFSSQLVLMIFAGIFGALVVCQEHVVVAMRKAHAQLKAMLLSSAVLFIVSIILVPRYLVTGAVIADLVFASLYFAVVECAVIRKQLL